MKTFFLIFSILISLLGVIVGQFAYPFIASLINSNPSWISVYIGCALILIISVLVLMISKQKFVRIIIILSCFLSCALTTIVLASDNYSFSSEYQNGYIYSEGGLRNKFGIKLLDRRSTRNGVYYSPEFFIGKTQDGNTVIVGAEARYYVPEEDDDDYERPNLYAKLRLEYYNEKGILLDVKMHEKKVVVGIDDPLNVKAWFYDCVNDYENVYICTEIPFCGIDPWCLFIDECSKEEFEEFT